MDLAEFINKLIFNNFHNIYLKYSLCTLKPGEKLSECNPASMPTKELGTISVIYGPIFNESLS
jgi:hypothetical protein